MHTKSGAARLIFLATLIGLSILAIAYLSIWAFAPLSADRLGLSWPFTLLGVAGALIANSTGVGGGAVFVPAFSLIRESGGWPITPVQVVGLSFAIQSFGMSVGSMTWLNRLHGPDAPKNFREDEFWKTTLIPLAGALPALLIVQRWAPGEPDTVFFAFKLFSILLGATLLLQLLVRKAGRERDRLTPMDQAALAVIGVAGGAVTAWFSVGVGELMALYLFLRRFPLETCVAPAVLCTAVCVVSGSVFYLERGQILFEILVFAAPGVALGGFLARRLAHALGAVRLKLMVAIWVMGSGLALLAL
jgi:uncharacterized membrane protein YfcA